MEIMGILKANNIPMHGTIDIRSNPAVRQQVMDVVRRAVPRPLRRPRPRPPWPHHRRPSTAQRLQELETLRATGTISEAEYTAKRQQIIAAL